MPADSPLDYVDYTAIPFPSDRISVADIRHHHPDLFDVEDAKGFDRIADEATFTLDLILDLERLIARAAYESARGLPPSAFKDRGMSRSECLDELAAFYSGYGVATGRKATEQLVRDIESRAAAQAVGAKL
jgi:hypothetical protein